MDKKDQIIAQQMELIRSMTEQNLRRVGSDFFGAAPSTPKKKEDTPAKTAAGAPTKDAAPAPAEPLPREDMADLQAELDGYIGLENIKKEVKNLINIARIYQKRRENDLPTADLSLHMVFSGNPGTGKTMIARFMARVYHSLGILSKGQLVEVDRSGLVAGYVGQTAIKTQKVIAAATGGVLFIDEAYTLTATGAENDFGQEAVDTVLKAMEDHRDDLIVIVAGYTELMQEFVESNPGLRSRFNRYLEFEDYTPEEMLAIFQRNCEKSCYTPDEGALAALQTYFSGMDPASLADFGNARGVRNTFEKILSCQADRLAGMEEITKEDLMQITEADVKTAVG